MLRHVLVPLDGSPLAEKALDVARRILAPEGKVTILASVDAYHFSDNPDSPVEICRRYLEHLATNLKLHGLRTNVEVGSGDPADLILERATTLGVEAIVLATTQGRSNISRLLFGSVTLRLIDETPCPVVIVPNREQQRVEEDLSQQALELNRLTAD